MTLRMFIEMNAWRWTDYPSVDEANERYWPWQPASGTRNGHQRGYVSGSPRLRLLRTAKRMIEWRPTSGAVQVKGAV